ALRSRQSERWPAAALREGLRSPDAFTLRRCQVLLASDKGQRPAQVADALGCSSQSVRDAIKAFGSAGARRGSARPAAPGAAKLRTAPQPVDARPGGRGLLREGLDQARPQRRVHPPGPEAPGRRLEARQALAGQPDPEYAVKKKRATG